MLSLNINTQFALNLSRQSDKTDAAMAQLSTGLRINSAGDDPAGTTIAEGLRAAVNGSQQAQANIQDAMNILKIGEDGVNSLLPVIDRMKELALKAANSTNTQADKDAMQTEVEQLRGLFGEAYNTAHTFRIALDGKDDADRVLYFQVGPNANDVTSVDYNPLRNVLGPLIVNTFGYADLYNSPFQEILAGQVGSPIPAPTDPVPPPPLGPATPPGTTWADLFPKKLNLNSGNSADIDATMQLLDNAKTGLTGQITYLGACEERLQTTLDTVSSVSLDLSSSESRIRDVDLASAMTEMTKSQIIQQSAQAMLSQANQRPQQVLQLLRPQ